MNGERALHTPLRIITQQLLGLPPFCIILFNWLTIYHRRWNFRQSGKCRTSSPDEGDYHLRKEATVDDTDSIDERYTEMDAAYCQITVEHLFSFSFGESAELCRVCRVFEIKVMVSFQINIYKTSLISFLQREIWTNK